MTKTLSYYDENAASFSGSTLDVDFHDIQDEFLSLLSRKAYILDFGCGAGRDTKYFADKGYTVTAVDGSAKLCEIASQYTGLHVRQMFFSELDDVEKYDGIWACASILHLPKDELGGVFIKMRDALVHDGILYTSFKYGEFEGMRGGRYFTCFTMESLVAFVEQIGGLDIIKIWLSDDVREDRKDERWVNILLKKKTIS